LDAKAGVDGAAELFEEEDEEEEPTSQTNTFAALTDVNEMEEDQDAQSVSSSESETDQSSSEDENENEEDPFAPVDEELKRKVQEALGDAGLKSDDDESEDEGLGDEEMKIFDDKLVEIFKQRKEIKSAKKGNCLVQNSRNQTKCAAFQIACSGYAGSVIQSISCALPGAREYHTTCEPGLQDKKFIRRQSVA
jgi:hypothetical protein